MKYVYRNKKTGKYYKFRSIDSDLNEADLLLECQWVIGNMSEYNRISYNSALILERKQKLKKITNV